MQNLIKFRLYQFRSTVTLDLLYSVHRSGKRENAWYNTKLLGKSYLNLHYSMHNACTVSENKYDVM